MHITGSLLLYALVKRPQQMLCVNKPAGLLSQADRTGDTDVLELAREYVRLATNKPGDAFVALVHRLDRPGAYRLGAELALSFRSTCKCNFSSLTVLAAREAEAHVTHDQYVQSKCPLCGRNSRLRRPAQPGFERASAKTSSCCI